MPKPFSLEELDARLRALVRRSKGSAPSADGLLSFGDLSINSATREVSQNGQTLQLTRMGYRLLKLLVEEAPRVVEREEVELVLWNGLPPASDALRSHVAALRSALEIPGSRIELVTHRGVGYQIKKG